MAVRLIDSFKPGMKVRVKMVALGSKEDNCSFVDRMQKFIGNIYTIACVQEDAGSLGRIRLKENSTWEWLPTWLEIVEDTRKYKVGDKVLLLPFRGAGSCHVMTVDSDPNSVICYQIRSDNSGATRWCCDKELEPWVEPAPAQPFSVGMKVKYKGGMRIYTITRVGKVSDISGNIQVDLTLDGQHDVPPNKIDRIVIVEEEAPKETEQIGDRVYRKMPGWDEKHFEGEISDTQVQGSYGLATPKRPGVLWIDFFKKDEPSVADQKASLRKRLLGL